VLPEQKMTDILEDMHIAEALVHSTPHFGDTNTRQAINYYQVIYQKHGVSDSIFKISYQYYMHHPVLLDSVYSEVITRLSDKEARLKGK
jgi:hypothetical protein